MWFSCTGLRELGLKVRRQRTRMALTRQTTVAAAARFIWGGKAPPKPPDSESVMKCRSQEARAGAKGSSTADCTNGRRTEKISNPTGGKRASAERRHRQVGTRKKTHPATSRAKAKHAAERELAGVEARLQANGPTANCCRFRFASAGAPTTRPGRGAGQRNERDYRRNAPKSSARAKEARRPAARPRKDWRWRRTSCNK